MNKNIFSGVVFLKDKKYLNIKGAVLDNNSLIKFMEKTAANYEEEVLKLKYLSNS